MLAAGIFLPFTATLADAGECCTVSGRLTANATFADSGDSVREDPFMTGRLTVEADRSHWRLQSALEGGWDGTVRSPSRDHSLLKRLYRVYQDNPVFLDVGELTAERRWAEVEAKIGIQRFAWGRLDEFPVNDLFNPWDYRHFLIKPLEERKIGVPGVSLRTDRTDWSAQLVWAPWLVPYRLPEPDERWSPTPAGQLFPGVDPASIRPQEPELPARTLANSSIGLRIQRVGEVEWAVDLFHGFDPRPLFRTTSLTISDTGHGVEIDPGFVPAFNRITVLGLDAALVAGGWSLRGEAAYTHNRGFNIRQELWGYPAAPTPGSIPLAPVEEYRDTVDYGLAGDYCPFEDGLLTLQAQQTVILNRPDTLYERRVETILWANLQVGWLNRKIETALNLACNPEHGATMLRPSATYIVNDNVKIGLSWMVLAGPPQSLFGRYADNDQLMLETTATW